MSVNARRYAGRMANPGPSGTATPLRVPKMAEVVAEHLRREIVGGELGEDAALPAAAVLMERFGVSKPTIREALRILESEGLIHVRRGATGARVRLPDEASAARAVGSILQLRGTTIADVTTALLVLEPWFVGQLAESRRPEDIARLREVVADARAALPNIKAFVRHQAAFHDLLGELAGNQTMLVLARLLDGVVRRQGARVPPGEEFAAQCAVALDEHDRVVDLIEAGAATEAQALWRTHLETGAANLLGTPSTVVDLYAQTAELGFPLA
jgi:GntR family transcriptional regulator, transcriptional repressor for pyruvate dehydrogenase complex